MVFSFLISCPYLLNSSKTDWNSWCVFQAHSKHNWSQMICVLDLQGARRTWCLLAWDLPALVAVWKKNLWLSSSATLRSETAAACFTARQMLSVRERRNYQNWQWMFVGVRLICLCSFQTAGVSHPGVVSQSPHLQKDALGKEKMRSDWKGSSGDKRPLSAPQHLLAVWCWLLPLFLSCELQTVGGSHGSRRPMLLLAPPSTNDCLVTLSKQQCCSVPAPADTVANSYLSAETEGMFSLALCSRLADKWQALWGWHQISPFCFSLDNVVGGFKLAEFVIIHRSLAFRSWKSGFKAQRHVASDIFTILFDWYLWELPNVCILYMENAEINFVLFCLAEPANHLQVTSLVFLAHPQQSLGRMSACGSQKHPGGSRSSVPGEDVAGIFQRNLPCTADCS